MVCLLCEKPVLFAKLCNKHYYKKHNDKRIDKRKIYSARNYAKNKEKRAEYGRLRYLKNKDKVKEHNSKIETRYRTAKWEGKKRTYEFEISFPDYELLISPNSCFYCYGKLNPTGSGLDRIDNNIGYIRTNVVPCCKVCNEVKGCHLTFEEMRAAMKVILDLRMSG